MTFRILFHNSQIELNIPFEVELTRGFGLNAFSLVFLEQRKLAVKIVFYDGGNSTSSAC